MRTAAGLLIFERERIGLAQPRGGYSRRGPLTDVSIHHGGPVGAPRMTFAAAAATWRSWQAYHFSQGWLDVGYHLGIDGLGRGYEGRPMWALPAAVGGHNTGMIGVNFMQDGRYYGLTPAQQATLRILVREGIPELGLPPIRRLIRDPRPGVGMYVHNEYSGHESNACAGTKIIAHVKWRRKRAAR